MDNQTKLENYVSKVELNLKNRDTCCSMSVSNVEHHGLNINIYVVSWKVKSSSFV